MTNIHNWIAPALSLVLGACSVSEGDLHSDAPVAQSDALSGQVKPTRTYYRVRRDLRRCASPMCGGYFVAAVNQPRTRCADGSQAAECYVAELLQPQGNEIAEGALVHGSLLTRSYPGIQGRWGMLDVDFAASPVLQAAPAGQHILAYDTGIRCITTPCPTIAATALNGPGVTSRPDVTFVAATEEEAARLEQAFFDELSTTAEAGTGALAVGNLTKRFDRRTRTWLQTLSVSNVYRVQEPTCVVLTNRPNTTAWNFGTRAEANAFAGGLQGEVQLIEGACDQAQLACTQEYNPVHGQIDALGEGCVGASNACGFRAAVIQAAGRDGKATGSFLSGVCPDVGESSGCEVIDCQPGDTCIEDAQGNGSCVFDACSAVRCAAGTHCELRQVQCFAAPCNPIAECVTDAECQGPIIDCAAPPPGCNYVDGGCIGGQWTCGHLVCDGSGP